jgi:putative transposase
VWLRIGIAIERIQPGHPQQNGRHERLHLTLKTEATKPAAANSKFIDASNNERPHEAPDMKCPGEVYQPAQCPYTGLISARSSPVRPWAPKKFTTMSGW